MKIKDFVSCLLACSVAASSAWAVNDAKPLGEPRLDRPTLHSLGAYWIIQGDDNQNASIAVEYRAVGSPNWVAGAPLFRVERRAHLTEKYGSKLSVPDDGWLFAGSVLLLKPDTAYELRLTLKDPDGGTAARTLKSRTRLEPRLSPSARKRFVVPGKGGGTGTEGDPFRGLETAQRAAIPGDLFLLGPGVYEGTWEITKSGTPEKPIVWRGRGSGTGKAVIDAQGRAEARPVQGIAGSGSHDVWFEDLTVRNAQYGLVFHDSARIVVRRCHIHQVEYGLAATRDSHATMDDHFIADNLIEGPSTWPRTKGIENARGIQISGQGHVVCYNRIRGFADAIDTFPSPRCAGIDVHNNDLSELTDDGVEMDFSERNTRCFHNRLTNVFQGISMQPVFGGPVYVFRNIMYNVAVEPFKLHNNPSGCLIFHNTVVKHGIPALLYTSERVRHSLSRNNVYVGTKAQYGMDFLARMVDCDFDYDGFAGGPFSVFLRWNGVRYGTLDEVRKRAPVLRHAVQLDSHSLFASKTLPPEDVSLAVSVPPDLRLSANSGAIDAGAVLPGLNDGFRGDRPDLGAYELGDAPPHYGPRLERKSETAEKHDPPQHGGRINQLKVLSDKIDDVTTVENIVKSFVKPGMSDQQHAEALWRAVVKYRHQTTPPNEFLAGDWEAHDPVKIFNVYGYCMCCCCSAIVEALNREDGRQARGRILNGHSVPEVWYQNGWHMFDGSLLTYFPRPEDGVAASVDEISAAVKGWYEGHPGYRKNRTRIMELMRKDGWSGWKSTGPALLANCPFYRAGYFPARTHGWDATMSEYDRQSEVYEYGYHVGHRALFSLRPGEALIREAGNRGLHVNMDRDPSWDVLSARAPENDLVYLKDFFPGYRGGVVANGTHRYAPNLRAGDLALGAEVHENLVQGDSGQPALRIGQAGKSGVVVIPMISPYVYLGGRLTLKAVGRTPDDRVSIAISTNNARSFTELLSTPLQGAQDLTVEFKDKVLRRYAYWIKLELSGQVGLDRLLIENDIQHAPRTLPWLGQGANTITVSADQDPAIATRSIACRITPDAGFTSNETSRTMGLLFDNVDLKHDACWWKGGTGLMTVPIETPGDLVSLGFSAQVRARGEKDRVRIVASTDGGKTWRQVAEMNGPTQGRTEHFRVGDWPSGTRQVLLRFEMTGNNTVGVQNFRIDADYQDPLASTSKTIRPFRVIHRWNEAGEQKTHAETIAKLPARYSIRTTGEPEMVSVAYEMPATP